MIPNPAAVLFDIDGTLIDSNYLHVAAWSQAFEEAGVPVDDWQIHRRIGMDSSQLLDELLGNRVAELGERVSDLNSGNFERMSSSLRAFDGARELVRRAASAGLVVVLATSAPESELKRLRAVLDIEESVATVTSSEDVGMAKPAPDLVQVALRKAGVAADRAIMVGDSVWDVEAAARAGVASIALRTGGTSAAELLQAGALAVYDDPRDLLANFDSSELGTRAGGAR